uniref:UDP-glycosyltransferases domain-containing protein n=1 Tax=Helicotheca tamesis TaxID=374047 RepID=A0A7S2ICA1_9STRA|mmetsp:Transcript_7617/g.10372  ORF Transcript_7617/g.10372 Transcript_7617/m.10372 type:complete len:457 (+) Transcript_7617:135-1505(+)
MRLEIVFATIPNMLGHLNPLLPYAEELLRRGHSITFFHGKDPKYRKKIEDSGISACRSVTYDDNLYDVIKDYYQNSSSSFPGIIVYDFFAVDAADAADFLDVPAVSVFPNMAVTINPWASAHTSSLLWKAWCNTVIPVSEGILARVLLWKRNKTRKERKLSMLIEQDIYPTRYQAKKTATGKPRLTIGCTSPQLEFNSVSELENDIFTMVGPALTSRVEPISTDLDRWLGVQSKHGRSIVYVAFGSGYKYTPKIVQALEKELLKRGNNVAFLWSLQENYQAYLVQKEKNEESDLSTSTHADYHHLRVESYFSQVALFRTGKIDAFVTHCGSNSVYEALLSGIPMVCCPRTADQPGNAVRLVKKGVGVIARNGIVGVGAALDHLLENFEDMKTKSDDLSQVLRSGEGGAKKAASVIEGIAHRSTSTSSLSMEQVGNTKRRMPLRLFNFFLKKKSIPY